MPDQHWVPLTFDRGLNTFDQVTQLQEGEVPLLDNMEWLESGGITPRPGWLAGGNSPTGGPGASARNGRGLETRWYESGVRKLVGAWSSGTSSYAVYKTDVSDPTAFTAYTSIESISMTAGENSARVSFAVGMGKLVYTHPRMPSAQIRTYDGATAAAVSSSPPSGRVIIYHLNRFFMGGSVTEPTYLRYCEIGDVTAWASAENFIPVGQDDGEPIEALTIWDRGMVIGKEHSLWFLSGDRVDSFSLQPIHAKIGCARGKSMVATELGVFFVSVDGNLFLYDGAEVTRLSRRHKVDTSVLTTGYYSLSYIAEKVYITHSSHGSLLWVYDLKRDRWRQERINAAQTNASVLDVVDDTYLIAQALNGSRALSVRREVGPYAISTPRTPQPDVGDDGLYEATTRTFYPREEFGKAELREIWIRYRQWTAGTSEPLTVTPIVDGVVKTAQAKTFGQKAAAGVYTERVTFGGSNMQGESFALKFSFNPAGAENETYALEEPPKAMLLADVGRR